ncbi:ankyrin repeat-containing domain protein [Apiospora saccharicola]
MADPLSIAAGIAGLISLADLVFTHLVDYGKSVKNAGAESRQLAKEVIMLRGILDSLKRLADTLDNDTFSSKYGNSYLEACKKTLNDIIDLLVEHQASTASTLRWSFKARRIKELHEELSRHKDTINMALSANSLEAVQGLSSQERDHARELIALSTSSLDAIHLLSSQEEAHATEIIAVIRDTSKITSRIQIDKQRSEIQTYYLRSNPQSNYETSRQLRHQGTGRWLVKLPEFQHWLAVPGSILWLKGIPGAGKTVLAGVVIEESLNKSTEVTPSAFFFCDYKNEDTHSPDTVLRALVYQLAIQKKEAYDLLEHHYETHHSTGMHKTPSIQSLSDLLQEMAGLYTHVFLTVDGIDECGTQADEVLETLIGISDATENISMALLSRDEDNIRHQLHQHQLDGLCVPIEIAAHKDDISDYVKAQLEDKIRKGQLLLNNPKLEEEILETLVNGAKGMFRWVACQLDELASCDSDQECRDALKSLPPTLDETYIRILQRIPPRKARMVGLALNCIAYSRSRLTMTQLRELLSIPKAGKPLKSDDIIHESAITKHCSSLLRKTRDGSFLEFSHFSVLEFLGGDRTKASNLDKFHVSKSYSEQLMAIEYLKYLQLGNFNELPSDMDDMDHLIDLMDEREDQHPLYSLAASDWLLYARDHWEQPDVMKLAKSLFSPSKTKAFTSWAATLTLGFEGRPLLDKHSIATIVVHADFTPLHLAAMLSLSEICSYLLEHHLDVNLESPVGNPLQCAVQGVSSFCYPDAFDFPASIDDYKDYRNWKSFPFASNEHGMVATRNTIDYLYGATLQFRCSNPFSGHNLLSIAFNIVLHFDMLYSPMALISAGEELQDEDVDHADAMLKRLEELYDSAWEDYSDVVERFFEALLPLVDKSPAYLRLCSLVWQRAAETLVHFTFDTTKIDTRVVYATGIDTEHVFETVGNGNEPALRMILQDPRFEPSTAIDKKTGNSLLHEAMGNEYFFTPGIVRLLLDAGCNTKSTNLAGELPIHLWMEHDPDDEDDVTRSLEFLPDFDVDCLRQDLKGDNVLHRAGSPSKLKAILECQSPDCIIQAMQATNAKGYAPFPYLLSMNCQECAEILTEYIKSFAMVISPVPVLLLAVKHNSERMFDFLINSDLGVSSYDGCGRNPLHFLGPWATEEFVIRLKLLYPQACKLHSVVGPPLASYMMRCLQELDHFWYSKTSINTAVITQLYVEDTSSFLIWEKFTSAIFPHPEVKNFKAGVAEFGMCLIKLGYLASYESYTKQSGLIPLIGPVFSEGIKVEESYSSQLLDQVTRQTNYWSTFLESNLAVPFLKATIKRCDTKLTQLLLDRGMSVHQRADGRSALEDFVCEGRSTIEARAVFNIIMSHAEEPRMDDIGNDGLGLLHLCMAEGSEWMIELLIQRGANPNLSATIGSQYPPVVHHLVHRRFRHASVLISSGADPRITSTKGFNAILAASWGGATQVLEDIYGVGQFKERAAWEKTATFAADLGLGGIELTGANGLHIASFCGNVSVLKFYQAHGLFESSFEFECDDGFRPIHYATLGGSMTAVDFLCGQGCDVMAKGKDGRTSLHLAAMNGNHEVVKALIQAGCRPSLDVYNRSPLFYVQQPGNQTLIEYLGSIDSIPSCSLQQSSAIGVASLLPRKATAAYLEDAITHNNLVLCQRLYDSGFSMESLLPSCGGCSPLIKAIIENRLEFIQWFLDKKVSMAKTACCLPGSLTTLHLILSKVTSVPILSKGLQNYMEQGGTFLGESPPLIHTTVVHNNIVGLRTLLSHLKQNEEHYSDINNIRGKDLLPVAVNEADPSSVTPIYHAAVNLGNIDAIDLLLDMGADVNSSCQELSTPLLGADIECRSPSGKTPLMEASWYGLFPIVQSLVDAKAVLAVTDFSKRSPLHFAARMPWTIEDCRIFATLSQRGLDIHSLDSMGWSALHAASKRSQFTSYLLNTDIRLEDSKILPWKWTLPLKDSEFSGFLRLARRKYRSEVLKRFINLSPSDAWSPLCLAAICDSLGVLDNLLGIGAQLDSDGPPSGSALMVACEYGRKKSVTFLIRRGAALAYSSPSGFRSAHIAAQKFPDILRWLLVGRFIDQAKLQAAATTSDGLGDSDFRDVSYTWGGPIQVELVITGAMERRPKESFGEYWIRLMREKKAWRGKVVPQSPGRRTTRDLNLWPKEYVHIHSDGYEAKS